MTEKKNTKEQIIEKAIKLFYESGYEKTTMRKIAELCGISHAAISKHFSNKSEIASVLIKRYFKGLIKLIQKYLTERDSKSTEDIDVVLLYWSLNFYLVRNDVNFTKFLLNFYNRAYNDFILIMNHFSIEIFQKLFLWENKKTDSEYLIDQKIIASICLILIESLTDKKNDLGQAVEKMLRMISVVVNVDLTIPTENINHLINEITHDDKLVRLNILQTFLYSDNGVPYTKDNDRLFDIV